MNICLPIDQDIGLKSPIYKDFASCKFFLIYNSEKDRVVIIDKRQLIYEPGKCKATSKIDEHHIDAVICFQICYEIFNILSDMNIDVFQAVLKPLKENIGLLLDGHLDKLTPKILPSCQNKCSTREYQHDSFKISEEQHFVLNLIDFGC